LGKSDRIGLHFGQFLFRPFRLHPCLCLSSPRRLCLASQIFQSALCSYLLPLFFLTLSLALPILFLSRWATFGLATASLKVGIIFVGEALFLNAWFPKLRGLDDANWSLGAEAFFYLTFPFLGPLLWKLRGYRLLLTGALVYVIGQGVVFISFHKLNWPSVAHLPLLHISTFALGILLARWQMQNEEGDGAHTTNLMASLVALLSLASIVAVIYWEPYLRMFSFDDGLLAPAFLALIWSCSHSELLPARILSVRWLVVLGEASYGLYLFHSPINLTFRRFGWNNGPIMFLVFAAVCIGVSVLSFYFYETPMRRWILKWSRGLVKETMEAASDA
jgi:peptidoglycan/LPS O-acetylase OafA/YrhL